VIEELSYSCNLCKRENLREDEVVWRGDDGWVCLRCDTALPKLKDLCRQDQPKVVKLLEEIKRVLRSGSNPPQAVNRLEAFSSVTKIFPTRPGAAAYPKEDPIKMEKNFKPSEI